MRTIKNIILESIVLPFSDFLLGYSINQQLKLHRKYSTYSVGQLEKLQEDKLQKILEHAVVTVPHYRNLIKYQSTDSIFSLKNFPVLKKTDLQDNNHKFISQSYRLKDLIILESSGSSGLKTTVYLSKEEHSTLRAILLNWWEWTGYYLGKPILQTGITPNRGLVKKIKDRLTMTIYCDAFGIDEKYGLNRLKKISKYENPHLGGYASSLFVLAEYAEKNSLELKFDGVICWGDKLFDHYKTKIESVFKTKVFENYGCNEGLMIAQKVDLDYYYIYSPNVYLEILDYEDNPVPDGEIGRVVITKLDGYAMPLIRYDTGDLAIKLPLNEYPKDRKFNFPLLKKVIGRNTDIVKSPDGKNLIVHTFTGIFEFFEEIKQFRVLQYELNSITIEFVPSRLFNNLVLEKIEDSFYKKTNCNIKIYWKAVDFIPNTASGKPQLIKNYMIERSLSEEK